MFTSRKAPVFTLLFLVLTLIAVLAFSPTYSTALLAQDEEAVACDSTLALLLLIAEHDYGYLTSMMDSEMEAPNLDLGQFEYIISGSMDMTMGMMEAMSEEDMAYMAEMEMMLESMMAMSTNDILAAYDAAMGMEMMEGMTVLESGVVAGENELCTTLRADVERFLVAAIVTEAQMMMMEGE